MNASRWIVAVMVSLSIDCIAAPAFAVGPICNVRAFGAKGDGATKDTVAIQKAIDNCAAKGGGTITLAGGTFVSGPLVLKSNTTLDVGKGAILLGSLDHQDYPKKIEFRGPGYQALVGAVGAEHVAITGGGVIDGNGASWWALARTQKNAGVLGSEHSRPRGIVFDHCRHVRIEA